MSELTGGLHGAYPRAELVRQLGPRALSAVVRSGRFTSFARSVLVDRAQAGSLLCRAAAVQLLAGMWSALTGFTALALYGCEAAPKGPVEVLVPYDCRLRKRTGLVVHRGSLVPQDIVELHGLRVMAVDYVLAEVLCRADRGTALACADEVLAMTTESERAELRATVEARILARPDPRGRRRGLVLLDLATGLPESPAESRFLLRLFDAGLPLPQRQYWVVDIRGREIYRLDFAWPELLIAVEYDGYEAHEGRGDLDAVRTEDLRRRGWTIIRASAADLRDPSRVVAQIRSAFAARGVAA